ncbi:hypothetical protein RSOLAG22IIIB_12716 [Rhizoctonia solani]|uniref:Uncharacterized protein n=1 Tax=Rhizoctonia solani TaxID=456999 RepID=A0A0K6GFK3_9AGAM|nr:hypothetical protein RSOLAG22IIIB_12716 [Rhizoctonia solani]
MTLWTFNLRSNDSDIEDEEAESPYNELEELFGTTEDKPIPWSIAKIAHSRNVVPKPKPTWEATGNPSWRSSGPRSRTVKDERVVSTETRRTSYDLYTMSKIEDGVYIISVSIRPGCITDPGEGRWVPLVPHKSLGKDADRIKIKYSEDQGAYSLQFEKSGKYLTFEGLPALSNKLLDGDKPRYFKNEQQPYGPDKYANSVANSLLTVGLCSIKVAENKFFRIVLAMERVIPLWNWAYFLTKRLTVRGFVVGELEAQVGKPKVFYEKMVPLVANGQIKWNEHVFEGLDKAGDAILAVQKGDNTAKTVVKVADA